MASYTVRQLARMAGVSVRTLHHYDRIGLLEPMGRTAAGYRLYGEAELLRLQQILLYRHMDLPLHTIGSILDDAAFDPVAALGEHRHLLHGEIERLAHLLQTIDRTIQRLEGDSMALTDEQLYEGFPKDQVGRIRRQARERYGEETVRRSEERARELTLAEWEAVKQEGDEVTRSLAALMDREPADEEVQALVARHYAWVGHFWQPNAEAYRGLGRLYVQDDEFRATYDRYRQGLADFLQAAIEVYAERVLDR